MIILGLADIHGDIALIDKISDQLAEADLVLLTGDLTHFGRRKDARRVVEAIQKRTDRLFAIPGNCDYSEVGDYLNEENINLDRRNVTMNGYGFIGIGGSLPCPGKTPNEASEEEFTAYLSESVSDVSGRLPLILVSHQPPYDTTCDALNTGIHVGSKAVRQFIENYTPLICFTGHIHESAAIDTIGDIPIINPGPLWHGRYAYARLSDDRSHVAELDIRNIS